MALLLAHLNHKLLEQLNLCGFYLQLKQILDRLFQRCHVNVGSDVILQPKLVVIQHAQALNHLQQVDQLYSHDQQQQLHLSDLMLQLQLLTVPNQQP